jgi:hypothetical protein
VVTAGAPVAPAAAPGVANLTALSGAGSAAIAVVPAGNLLKPRMNATTSAVCSGVSVPGAVNGIVFLIASNNSPTVRSFQPAMNSMPASAGPIPPASVAS